MHDKASEAIVAYKTERCESKICGIGQMRAKRQDLQEERRKSMFVPMLWFATWRMFVVSVPPSVLGCL